MQNGFVERGADGEVGDIHADVIQFYIGVFGLGYCNTPNIARHHKRQDHFFHEVGVFELAKVTKMKTTIRSRLLEWLLFFCVF